MLLLRSELLPDGPEWLYEVKLDGYRAIAVKAAGKVHLRSRNNKDFNGRYPPIVNALTALPDETVIDGELVALDQEGRPSFNLLQNYRDAPIFYYVFDVLLLAGRNLTREPATSLAYARAPGGRCESIKGRNLSLADTRRAPGLSIL